MGEVGGITSEAFDFPNSPRPFLEIQADFSDITMIHRSSSDTSGVCWAAPKANLILAAGFNVAEATAQVILQAQPDVVLLSQKPPLRSPAEYRCNQCAHSKWEFLSFLYNSS